MTTATPTQHDATTERVLLMACELSEKTWKLGCTTGHGQKPRERAVAARPQARLLQEIAQATRRCGLPETAPVVRCDEAGREGCWLHRFVPAQGSTNQVVDASSLAVNRRQRRAKSAGLDVRQLLSLRRRYEQGERAGWHVVHVPSGAAEDGRHRHRDLATLQQERASTTPRLKGGLRSQGIRLTSLRTFPEPLDALRLWDGAEMPSGRRRRVLRVWAHPPLLSAQSAAWEAARRAVLHSSEDARLEQVRQLMHLQGSGLNGAWWLVRAFVGGRALKNRREVGGGSRLHADPVSKRRECAGTRHHPVGESAGARDDHGAGLELET